jgi:plastocyanin
VRRPALGLVFALLLSLFPPATLAQEELRASVTIGDNLYEPAQLTVAPGTTVTWTHAGADFHTVTSYDSIFDSGFLRSGDIFEWTFADPGEYWYFCILHDGQEGVVYVAAPEAAAPEPAAPEVAAEPLAPTPENVSSAPPPAPTPIPPAATPVPATATLIPTATPTATIAPSAPLNAVVNIQNFSFQPSSVTVAVGGAVTWTNQDNTPHTATGNGISTGTLNRGQSGSATFSRAGTYPYQCSIHPNMTGQVVVVG